MATNCSICGNSIGAFQRSVVFKDGVVCSDCIKKTDFAKQAFALAYATRTRAAEWASFHTIHDFKMMLVEGKAGDIGDEVKDHRKENKAIAKEQRQQIKAEVKAERKADTQRYEEESNLFQTHNAKQFGRVWFDATKKKILIRRTLLSGDWATYDYSQVLSYAPVENGHSDTKKKHGITRTLVGGALLGGVGAIAGAASSGSTAHDVYDWVSVTVTFDDGKDYEAVMLRTKTDARQATQALIEEQKMVGLLDAIIRDNQVDATSQPAMDAPATPEPTTSVANELRELKSLVDDGIITQDDFNEKKKQLLNL